MQTFFKIPIFYKINRSNINAQTFPTLFIFIMQIHNIYAFNIKAFYPIEFSTVLCSYNDFIYNRKKNGFARENTSKKAFKFISSFSYKLCSWKIFYSHPSLWLQQYFVICLTFCFIIYFLILDHVSFWSFILWNWSVRLK